MAKGLRIIARKEGFRRAGIAHTTEPKDYPLSEFTDEQVAALKGEPNLIVQDITIKEEKADK